MKTMRQTMGSQGDRGRGVPCCLLRFPCYCFTLLRRAVSPLLRPCCAAGFPTVTMGIINRSENGLPRPTSLNLPAECCSGFSNGPSFTAMFGSLVKVCEAFGRILKLFEGSGACFFMLHPLVLLNCALWGRRHRGAPCAGQRRRQRNHRLGRNFRACF